MKTTPRLLLAVLVTATAPQLFAHTPANTTTARILGDLPDGTPPPPEAPKPGFTVKPSNVLSSKTYQQGGRTLTLGEIKPIALPAPFQPAPPSPSDPALQERFKNTPEVLQDAGLLFVGASVFHLPDGTARSLVTLEPQGTGEPVTLFSSADFGLLASIGNFTGTDGKNRALILSWSSNTCENPTDLATQLQQRSGLKKIPKLAPGRASYTLVSGNPDPTTLSAIQSIHELYQTEHPRLTAADQGRERARLQQEAQLKAQPPQPKNLVLHHWNIGKSTPAPTEGGAK
jgi:hypothetical protein